MKEKILILGLSKSGIAAAKLGVNLGYNVFLTESKKDVDEIEVKKLQDIGVNVEYGSHSDEFIKGASFVITSPGIPPKSDIFKKIQNENIPIISEVEFAYLNSDTPFISITGTNGKTTTTTLVSHILSQCFDAPACGNIGVPPSLLVESENDFLVAEISSYQAQMTSSFKPFISCWTNFTPDHIDWHGGLENYFNAKAKLFLGKQAPSYVILNAMDGKLLEFSKQCKNSKVFLFDTENYPNASFIKDNFIWYKEDYFGFLKEIRILPFLLAPITWESSTLPLPLRVIVSPCLIVASGFCISLPHTLTKPLRTALCASSLERLKAAATTPSRRQDVPWISPQGQFILFSIKSPFNKETEPGLGLF